VDFTTFTDHAGVGILNNLFWETDLIAN